MTDSVSIHDQSHGRRDQEGVCGMSGYPVQWYGNAEGKSGTAVWMVEGNRYEIKLETLEDMQAIDDMLSAALKIGRAHGASEVWNAVKVARIAARNAGVYSEWLEET